MDLCGLLVSILLLVISSLVLRGKIDFWVKTFQRSVLKWDSFDFLFATSFTYESVLLKVASGIVSFLFVLVFVISSKPLSTDDNRLNKNIGTGNPS